MPLPPDRRPAEAGHDHPRSTAKVFGHPLHPMLVPIPIACFIGTLITDITYTQTYDMLWATFSVWLLAAGLVGALFAVITGMTDFAGDKRVRNITAAWVHGIGNGVASLLAIFNVFVHSRDGATAVIGAGLTLSILTVAIMAVTAWLGGTLVYKHGVGVAR